MREPPFITLPATWTDLALRTAFLAAVTIPSGDFLSTPFVDGPLLPPQAATAIVTMVARMPEAKHRRLIGETYPVWTPGCHAETAIRTSTRRVRTRVGTREDGRGRACPPCRRTALGLGGPAS